MPAECRSCWSATPARSTSAQSTTWRRWPTSPKPNGCGITSTAPSARSIALDPELRPRLRGIERSDSLAFDLHKWLHVPYDAGCVIVRDRAVQRATFALDASYLRREVRGIAAGDPWFADFGPELSRGFRALKVWFTVMHFGADRLAAGIRRNIDQAAAFGRAIAAAPGFELTAPVNLNIVAFRFHPAGIDDEGELEALNREIVLRLQESGTVVLSTTRVHGRFTMRMNLTNHRTTDADLRLTLEAVQACSASLTGRDRDFGKDSGGLLAFGPHSP